MANLNYVYYLGIQDVDEYWYTKNGYGQITAKEYAEQNATSAVKTKTLWLDKTIPGDFYFFIITKNQKDYFLAMLDKYKLHSWVKAQSKETFKNMRYPIHSANLNWFLLQRPLSEN